MSANSFKVTNVCKKCSHNITDLMVIQCNASNDYGYDFASVYLNVLGKLTFNILYIKLASLHISSMCASNAVLSKLTVLAAAFAFTQYNKLNGHPM